MSRTDFRAGWAIAVVSALLAVLVVRAWAERRLLQMGCQLLGLAFGGGLSGILDYLPWKLPLGSGRWRFVVFALALLLAQASQEWADAVTGIRGSIAGWLLWGTVAGLIGGVVYRRGTTVS